MKKIFLTCFLFLSSFFFLDIVKAYDFIGYSNFSKFYLLGESSSGSYKDFNFTSGEDYYAMEITEDIFPLSRLAVKLYKSSFSMTSDYNYKFTVFVKANFDISSFKNEFTFRLCSNDYTCNVVEPLDFTIEQVDTDIYKISVVYNAIISNPKVITFWFDDVSNVPVGSYYGFYRYYKIEEYVVEDIEQEEPQEPEEQDNYIYIPQMSNYPISTNLIDSYMKNKIDLSIYDDVFYETCYESGSRYFWAYYMSSSNDFSYNNSTGVFTINPVTNGTFYRVMFVVNSSGIITGMSSVETWNQSLTINYNTNTNKRLYFSTFDVYDPNGNLLIEGFEKEEVPSYTTEIVKEPGQTTFNLNFSEYDMSIFQVSLCYDNSCYPVKTFNYSLVFTESTTLSLSIYHLKTNETLVSDDIIIEVEPRPIEYEYSFTFNQLDIEYFYIKYKASGTFNVLYKIFADSIGSSSNIIHEEYQNSVFYKYWSLPINTDLKQTKENILMDTEFIIKFPVENFKDYVNNEITIKFSVPGLISYGTENISYSVDDSTGEIISSPNDDSTLNPGISIDQDDPIELHPDTTILEDLNSFNWLYSLIGRNGNNLKDIKINSFGTSIPSDYLDKFSHRLVFNYNYETYYYNLNDCMKSNICDVKDYQFELLKNILFDRDIDKNNYLRYQIIPKEEVILSTFSETINFGVTFEFSSTMEVNVNSILLAIKSIVTPGVDISNFDIQFRFYDSSDNIHTIVYHSLLNTSVGINKFDIPDRLSDIYKLDFSIIYHISGENPVTVTKDSLIYLDISELNFFASTEIVKVPGDLFDKGEYRTCNWYDMFCHGQNLINWFLYDCPVIKEIWSVVNFILNTFMMFYDLLTNLCLFLDFLPPILGVNWSTLAPMIVILSIVLGGFVFKGGRD